MWIEITKELFDSNVTYHDMIKQGDYELHCEVIYGVLGVRFKKIFNHISAVEQYFIQDINA